MPDNEKKNGSSLPENDESNVSLSAADKKSAACRVSNRRRHAVFAKRKKTGRRAACEIDDKPYTLAGLAESTE
ncbi:hypothetical protein LQ759_05065 [Serratia marcescens]|nr:hypothetical protein [Serratia marcescens]